MMIIPLSAFSLGLKLVDSCSIGRLLFYLHFLILILVHGVKKKERKDLDGSNEQQQSHLKVKTKMLILITDVFSSPAGPCGSESSV